MDAQEALELGIIDEVLDRMVKPQNEGGVGDGKPPTS